MWFLTEYDGTKETKMFPKILISYLIGLKKMRPITPKSGALYEVVFTMYFSITMNHHNLTPDQTHLLDITILLHLLDITIILHLLDITILFMY